MAEDFWRLDGGSRCATSAGTYSAAANTSSDLTFSGSAQCLGGVCAAAMRRLDGGVTANAADQRQCYGNHTRSGDVHEGCSSAAWETCGSRPTDSGGAITQRRNGAASVFAGLVDEHRGADDATDDDATTDGAAADDAAASDTNAVDAATDDAAAVVAAGDDEARNASAGDDAATVGTADGSAASVAHADDAAAAATSAAATAHAATAGRPADAGANSFGRTGTAAIA
mmetsp:Transcript_11734/g.25969  ORF Transcript_11734/g.25969 Transcript_11734/m.25969 type:complete len:228 (+) Transcript_11734:1543-2226(+)